MDAVRIPDAGGGSNKQPEAIGAFHFLAALPQRHPAGILLHLLFFSSGVRSGCRIDPATLDIDPKSVENSSWPTFDLRSTPSFGSWASSGP